MYIRMHASTHMCVHAYTYAYTLLDVCAGTFDVYDVYAYRQ